MVQRCSLIWSTAVLLLAGCEAEPIAIADIVGTYRADVPAGHATLVINMGGTWEYHIEGKSRFRRSGKWTLEAKESTRSVVATNFEQFDLGFPLNESGPYGPGHWFFAFKKASSGKLRTCIENLGPKWGPKGRICFEQE
jgi:hypothetical protein